MDKKLENLKIERPSWSNLPSDISILILKRLRYIDQIRFLAVCKHWRLDIPEVKRDSNLPWVMSWYWPKEDDGKPSSLLYNDNGSVNTSWCDLYDPIWKQKQTIVENKECEIFAGAEFCDTKDGWVLFSRREVLNTIKTTSFFFYNPFAQKIIKLARSDLKVSAASFTTAPDSQDCLIFAYSEYKYSSIRRKTSIGIYSPRKKTWKRLYFDCYHGNIQSLVYINGVFYCAFCYGVMGSFKLATQEWKTYKYPAGVGPRFDGNRFLVESDGRLLLTYKRHHDVLIVDKVPINQGIYYKWVTYLFVGDDDDDDDESKEKNWREVESLDNGLLFINEKTSNSMLVPVTQETSDLRNTFHRFCGGTSMAISSFYKEHERQLFDWLGLISCRQLYNWLGLIRSYERIWIYPPQIKS